MKIVMRVAVRIELRLWRLSKVMEYTKGEWRAYCLGSEGYQVRNSSLAGCDLKERLTPIVERMGGSFETQKANANLIASAPDLYEACKATDNMVIIKTEEGYLIPSDALRKIKKAIAKAEGKDES